MSSYNRVFIFGVWFLGSRVSFPPKNTPLSYIVQYMATHIHAKKVQVGKDQEKAQSEKDSHSKHRGGKKPNQQSGTYTMKPFRKPNEQLFSQ